MVTPTSLVLSVARDHRRQIWACIRTRSASHRGRKSGTDCRDGSRALAHQCAITQWSSQTLWMGYQNGVASYANGQLAKYAAEAGAPPPGDYLAGGRPRGRFMDGRNRGDVPPAQRSVWKVHASGGAGIWAGDLPVRRPIGIAVDRDSGAWIGPVAEREIHRLWAGAGAGSRKNRKHSGRQRRTPMAGPQQQGR